VTCEPKVTVGETAVSQPPTPSITPNLTLDALKLAVHWPNPDPQTLIDELAPAEWAAALNLLAGGKEQAFVRSATTLLAQGDSTLAHKLVELGLLSYPSSPELSGLRRQALDRLRELYQQLSPFKFIVYSGWAGAELPPLTAPAVSAASST